jgi:Domain of unknown function (DUF4440)
MSELNAEVAQFFAGYEKANSQFDPEKIGGFYADHFMFAGPNGAQPVQKEGFVKVLPKRKEFFRSVGLASSSVQTIEPSRLDAKYVLAKVEWKMRFEGGASGPLESRAFATYVMAREGDSFRIIFQVDHQDLMKEVERLGIRPPR